ncbi:hypothetical protein KY290_005430 [Solanum tuberosum]|uniref:DUF4283 domain-containing protein n=1 Tax=Solanum tuberosum TaxID=4113 RepID=A0ABQ7WE43_SOLTU|nr:hypothetical protein KY289_005823 [Solanum tuberosum]KAH0779003.1 hypothetical protein KY290_005430 [Solanum tuberosum]
MEGRTFFTAGEKSFELIDISEDRVRWFKLCERSRRFVGRIRIDENNLRWVCGAMKEASKGEGKLCRRWGRKIEAYIFRVYQNFNSYGRFVRIEAWLGDKKSSVIIPEIVDNGGWEDIANKILRFLWRPPMQSEIWSPNSQARSFCEVSKMEKWPTIESSRPNQAIPATASDNRNFLDKCLVGRFNDSFHNNPHYDTIQKWFCKRWKMTAGLKVSPISHNLFLFEMPSRQEAARVEAGDWFWNGRRLSLDWWSPLVDLDTKVLPLGDRWIKAFGIPLHAWSKSSFQKIGELCGGYLLIPDAHTKIWDAGEEADRKGKRKVGEEEAGFSRKAEVNTVVRPLAQHVPFTVDSNLPANQIVGPNPNNNGIRKRADFNSKVGPSGYKGKAFFKRGPNQDKRNNKRKNTWTPRAQDPCIFNSRCSPAREFLDPITFELQALERQRVVFDNEDFDCHSNCEADDEGDKGSTYSLSLHDFQDQSLEIPKQITCLFDAATDSDQSSISRNNDHLLLPWHGEGIPGQQVIHTPSVISTSKWTKLVMVKACKAFGVNAIGFEHELLGMILRMDQRRQDQAKQRVSSSEGDSKMKKKKGATELKRLSSGLIQDVEPIKARGRSHKAQSR